MDYLFNPIITPAVIAGMACLTLLVIGILHRAALSRSLNLLRSRLFTRSGLFWAVNVVFMGVSVLHAGIFFGITGNGHDLPGMTQWLGFAVSFFLDLVTIILMQAMLEARYRGEPDRARQFLLFITVCCGTSTFANLAISLNDFDAKVMLPHAPLWVQVAAPYVLASFPLFVIMMSIAAEMIVNVRPLESLDEEEYETDEKKRVRILEIRNTYLQKQADEDLRALTIRAQMKANKHLRNGNTQQWFRWPWEKAPALDQLIAGVTAQLKAIYEPQIEALKQQLMEQNPPVLVSDQEHLFEDQRAQIVAQMRADLNTFESKIVAEMQSHMPQNEPLDATSLVPLLAPTLSDLREEMVAQMNSRMVTPEPLDSDKIVPLLVPTLNQLREDIEAQMVTAEPLDYERIVQHIQPVLSQFSASLQEQIEGHLDLSALAFQMAPMLIAMSRDGTPANEPVRLVSRRITRVLDMQCDDYPDERLHERLHEYSDDHAYERFDDHPHDHTDDHPHERFNEHSNERKNTDELDPVRSTKRSPSGTNEALKKVRRLVKRNAQITPTELARKLQISRSYAGKLKAQVLMEKVS